MSKTYQIKSLDAKGQPQIETIQPAPGRAPTVIKAVPGTRYTLTEVQQGSAPDNIRVQRSGKHLRIMFDGSSQPDVVIEDFFDGSPSGGKSTLTGTTDRGALHEYVPETGIEQHSLSRLEDNDAIHGMALGGIEVPANTGAAVGLLAPLAGGGLGIGAAGAGAAALGAAALAGGGGGGGGDTAPAKPKIEFLALATTSDSGPVGDNITKVQRPTIVGKATANSEVTVTLNNKTYTTTADANGDFSITVPDTDPALNAGRYTLQAVAKQSGILSESSSGTPFIVDVSGNDNIGTSGNTTTDTNKSAVLAIQSIADDTGSAGDFITSDNTLNFAGQVGGYTNNSDKIRITLEKLGVNDTSTLLFDDFLAPDAQNNWNWNLSGKTLEMGKYTLTTVVVDGAGNVVSAINSRDILIDNDSSKNVANDGTVVTDANTDRALLQINSLSNDTGNSNSDFQTNDNTLFIQGALEKFTANGDLVMVQLTNSSGEVAHAYITPSGNTWAWDLSSLTLHDGQYSLHASIVDATGTQVSGTSIKTKILRVDTSFSQNIDDSGLTVDANAGVQLSIAIMTDTDNSNTDWITNKTQPVFSGSFGTNKNWTNNSDSFKFQIFDTQGHLVAGTPKAEPSSNNSNWSAQIWNTTLPDGTYVAQAIATDVTGNVLSVSQQAFAVDHSAPNLTLEKVSSTATNSSTSTVSYLGFSFDEAVQFTIQPSTGATISSQYTGTSSVIDSAINGTFKPGELKVTYTDYAGNTNTYSNTEIWVLNDLRVHLITSKLYTPTLLPSNVPRGSMGSYSLTLEGQTLDLTSLTEASQNSARHNQIDMSSTGTQHLILNLNDVLSVGVTNSFTMDNRIQLRVDGDSHDTLSFKDVSTTAWTQTTSVTLDGIAYDRYISHDANFMDLAEVLVQHGVTIT